VASDTGCAQTLTKILATLKERRQIIVTTHNPNIVVGGDAEQVVVLESKDEHEAHVEVTGSIDDPEIIEAVVAIIEGGREAFAARNRRYGPSVPEALAGPSDLAAAPPASA
jgi:DNA repair ATPase RecN